MRFIFTSFLLVAFLFPEIIVGQETEFKKPKDSQIVLLAGYSPISVRLLGKTPDSQTQFSYLGYRKEMDYRILGLKTYYSVGLYPVIKYNYSKRDNNGLKDVSRGVGISPIGFYMTKEIRPGFAWSFSSNGGLIFMDKIFPTDKGKKLNYMFDLNGEFIWALNPNISLSLGYKFHHISNAQTGTENPGLDSNIFFISIII
jgi:hypothetical protein